MKMDRLNDNWNNVKTKEELLELLKKYRGILNEYILNYLNSLVELEFSVIREYISDSDREVLAELDVYKTIAIYNIYHRTQKLFNQQNGEFAITGNTDGLEGLSISTQLNDRIINLFDFDYKEICIGGWDIHKMLSDFKPSNMWNISLYQTLESKALREDELYRVMQMLENLYDERNPYSSRPGVVGGSSSTWLFEHTRKIQKYEERFKQLDSKKELSDVDKREIEITKQIHNLLLEDFCLTKESFVDETNQSFSNLGNEPTELRKTLVRRMPNLTITNHTKYI